jgi:hypothetical protein
MTTFPSTGAVAAEHVRDLTTAGARHRLARLAACCRPGTWTQAGGRLRRAVAGAASIVRRSQLGPARCCA